MAAKRLAPMTRSHNLWGESMVWAEFWWTEVVGCAKGSITGSKDASGRSQEPSVALGLSELHVSALLSEQRLVASSLGRKRMRLRSRE